VRRREHAVSTLRQRDRARTDARTLLMLVTACSGHPQLALNARAHTTARFNEAAVGHSYSTTGLTHNPPDIGGSSVYQSRQPRSERAVAFRSTSVASPAAQSHFRARQSHLQARNPIPSASAPFPNASGSFPKPSGRFPGVLAPFPSGQPRFRARQRRFRTRPARFGACPAHLRARQRDFECVWLISERVSAISERARPVSDVAAPFPGGTGGFPSASTTFPDALGTCRHSCVRSPQQDPNDKGPTRRSAPTYAHHAAPFNQSG
jgi:hypothetical protein